LMLTTFSISQQSVRNLVPIFYENSAKLASQWMKLLDGRHDAVEIEITNWAARFASVFVVAIID
jgi:hypothetical protein